MKITFSDKLAFFKASLKKNLVPLLIGLTFIILGLIVAYISYFVAENTFLTGFGLTFIAFSGFFLLYTMPSSFLYYYSKHSLKNTEATPLRKSLTNVLMITHIPHQLLKAEN